MGCWGRWRYLAGTHCAWRRVMKCRNSDRRSEFVCYLEEDFVAIIPI